MAILQDLEEEINKVWATSDDLDTVLYRMLDAFEGPPTEDELSNLLEGLKELHNSRCMKLWDTYEAVLKTGKVSPYAENPSRA